MSQLRSYLKRLDWLRLRRTALAFLLMCGLFCVYSAFVTPLIEGPYWEQQREKASRKHLAESTEEITAEGDLVVIRVDHPEDVLQFTIGNVNFGNTKIDGVVDLMVENKLFGSEMLRSIGVTEAMLRVEVPQALGLERNPRVQDVIETLDLPPESTLADVLRALALRVALKRTQTGLERLWKDLFGMPEASEIR